MKLLTATLVAPSAVGGAGVGAGVGVDVGVADDVAVSVASGAVSMRDRSAGAGQLTRANGS